MPDLDGRDDFEERIAREMQKVFNRQFRELLEKLGDPPDINNLTQEDWDKVADEYAQVLTNELETVYIQAAEAFESSMGYNVNDGVVNTAASNWARQYKFDWVSRLTNTTRTQLQEAVSDFYERPMTMGQMREKLRRTFGPVRATMIARTEITRATTQGEAVIRRELERIGLRGKRIHQTRNDELVCPICGPRHDQEIKPGDPEPPLHINCRCWEIWEPFDEFVSFAEG